MGLPLLSQKDANAALDLIHASVNCRCTNEFRKLLVQLQDLIGFDQSQCFYGDLTLLAAKKFDSIFFASRFDEDWMTRYLEKDYFFIDSVALAATQQAGLHYWDDARERFATSQTRRVDDEARSVGLHHGWAYTLANGRAPLTSALSLAGERLEKNPHSQRILDLVMPHLAESLKRIAQDESSKSLPLTPRETEILTWLTVGKTAWEISVILRISSRTVQFHIANIITKLQAVNARHAVAIATALGIVRP